MKNRKRVLTTAALLFLLLPFNVWGMDNDESMSADEKSAYEALFGKGPQEEDYYRTDRLLLTATGSLKPVRLAPSVATVITSEDIEKIGASTLDDVLQTVPGLYAAPSGGNILSSVWSIRGIRTTNNPQVLLLLNGVPMTQVHNGQRTHTYHMPVAMISRIEVVRGPGSAVHGADAFAGTINVITKDGHELDGTRAGVRYGSFETSDYWLQHGGEYYGWDIAAGAEARKSQGDKDRIVDQDQAGSGPPSFAPGALDTRFDQVDAHLSFNKKDKYIARFYGAWISDNAMGPGALQYIEYDSNVNSHQFIADLRYNNDTLVQDWDFSILTSYFYIKTSNDFMLIPAANIRGNPGAITQTSTIEAVGLYEGLNKHLFRLATGLKYTDTDTFEYKNFAPFPPGSGGVTGGAMIDFTNSDLVFMVPQNRSLWHVSLQDEWSFAKKWELTVGVRYDDYSDFGSTTNPRAALVWETTPALTSKLIYGRAFRPPAFEEMYINYNPSRVGNPNIDPETIDTYEMAFIWQPISNLLINPSLFYYKIKGLIELSGTESPDSYDNRRDQKGHGFEIEVNWQALENLELTASLAGQRSEDADSGAPVADTPEWQAYLNSNWEFLPDWNLDGQLYWIAERNRAAGDLRADVADYELVNLTLRRKNIAKNWEAAVSIRNLFDEHILEPSSNGTAIPNDLPMESRAIWAEVSFHY